MLQVEHNTALVAVQMKEAAGHAFMAIGPVGPERVALLALDLDHVSPEIGHDVRRKRSHDHVGQVDHANSAQRAVCRGRVHPEALSSIGRDGWRVTRGTSNFYVIVIRSILFGSVAPIITYAIDYGLRSLAGRNAIKHSFAQPQEDLGENNDIDKPSPICGRDRWGTCIGGPCSTSRSCREMGS